MNTHIKTWLGTLIISIMAITAGMFIWKVYEINTAYAPAPQTIQIPKPKAKENNLGMANPASVFCQQNGGKLEIITAEDGSQSGMCKFSDGSQCEEWAFQRGECKIGDSQKQVDTSNWQTYRNKEYGFEVKYPKEWNIDQERTTANEIVFDMGIPESRESIEFFKNTKNLNLNQLKIKKVTDMGVIEDQSEMIIDGEKVLLIKTTEFGMNYLVFNHKLNAYIVTTGGRILDDGIISTFKFTN